MATPRPRSVHSLALLSGFLGATASCFAKFAFSSDSAPITAIQSYCQQVLPDATHLCYLVQLVPRGLALAAMIGCNAAMMGSFVSGMEESGSVAGTALSSAANFAASAAYGYVLFDERFTGFWWVGLAMVLTGVTLLSSVPETREEKVKKQD